MVKNKNNSSNAQDLKGLLYTIGTILVVGVVVILIILATKNAKPKITLTETPPPQETETSQPKETESSSIPELVSTKQYSSMPDMLIDTAKKYTATVTMADGGVFTIELYADKAPITVNSFVFLARQGYFDGVTFHRVLKDFMAQGGDPTGTGGGGPGYEFEYEDSGLSFDKAGVVAMANAGPQTATNGSQFFITFGPTPHLDGGYTIFGQVISGMDVVNGLTLRDPQQSPDYEGDAIKTITIAEE